MGRSVHDKSFIWLHQPYFLDLLSGVWIILYRRITNLCPWPVLLGQRTVPSREVFVPSLAYELFGPTRISDCGQGTRIVFQIKTEVRWSKVFLAFALVRESANWESPLTQRNFVPAIDSGWLRASAHSQISNPLNHVVATCSSPWRRRCLSAIHGIGSRDHFSRSDRFSRVTSTQENSASNILYAHSGLLQ